jgi:signal transduction histidine kinase/CheY-like chemotaxis protein
MTPDAQSQVDRLPCGWLKMERQGAILAVNATLCRMLGAPVGSLIGKHLDSLLTRPSRVLFQSYLQPLLLLHGHVEEFSLSFQGSNGNDLHALVYSANAGPGEVNRLELVVASLRRRRDIEEEMLRIKRAADHAPGMIFQLLQRRDGSCHFPYTSESIRRMYGLSSRQACESAEPLLGLLDAETRGALSRSLRDAARSDRDWSAVFQVTLPGSAPRWHEAQATPRHLADGVILWHGHCADVTDRRAMEVSAADRLALERMHEARSEFLARVSHELRTPLNAILGFTQLLATDKADNLSIEQHERLEVVSSSSRHLLTLVNEVLEVTTIEAGQLHVELQSFDLLPLLERALQTVRVLAQQARVHLLLPLCPAGLRVLSNEQRLHQVLVNLLSNAIKYNHPAGTVQLAAQGGDQEVTVAVVDTGLGLTTQQRAALFQPFNRLGAEKTGVAGNGLGLVITKELLTVMGARLDVESEPGHGSTFSVRLAVAAAGPVAPADADAPASSQAPKLAAKLAPNSASNAAPEAAKQAARQTARQAATQATQLASGTVLYVEDDEVNVALMSAVLGLRPHIELHIANDIASALKVATQSRPDLLLLDMHLPDGNGIDLLSALRKLPGLQAVPAIMVSAGAHSEDLQLARTGGFVSYWTKPLDVNAVLAALDSMLGQTVIVPH